MNQFNTTSNWLKRYLLSLLVIVGFSFSAFAEDMEPDPIQVTLGSDNIVQLNTTDVNLSAASVMLYLKDPLSTSPLGEDGEVAKVFLLPSNTTSINLDNTGIDTSGLDFIIPLIGIDNTKYYELYAIYYNLDTQNLGTILSNSAMWMNDGPPAEDNAVDFRKYEIGTKPTILPDEDFWIYFTLDDDGNISAVFEHNIISLGQVSTNYTIGSNTIASSGIGWDQKRNLGTISSLAEQNLEVNTYLDGVLYGPYDAKFPSLVDLQNLMNMKNSPDLNTSAPMTINDNGDGTITVDFSQVVKDGTNIGWLWFNFTDGDACYTGISEEDGILDPTNGTFTFDSNDLNSECGGVTLNFNGLNIGFEAGIVEYSVHVMANIASEESDDPTLKTSFTI